MLTAVEIVGHVLFLFFAATVEITFIAGMVAVLRKRRRSAGEDQALEVPTPDPMPYVTTLLPVYQETESLARNCARYQQIRYPRDGCELLILTEEHDANTNAVALQMARQYDNVRHEIIPAGYLGADHPRNKPRALAFGLTRLQPKTTVVGVLDAEDLVAPDLLLEAAKGLQRFAVVQGRLAIKNQRENLLSYWSGVEYAFLELLQEGRDLLGWVKFPRGSTCFVGRNLIQQIGWSTRNLTEDLAFTIRSYAEGHQTGLIDTTTWEESPLRLGAWVKQRTRWLQGFLQTIGQRPDLSRLTFWQRFSVRQLLYHVALIPLLTAIMLPLLFYDLTVAIVAGPKDPVYRSAVPAYVWLTDAGCMGLICLEFAVAAWIAYRGDADRWKRLLACLALPLLFMGLLPLAGVRAYWREFSGARDWEKTRHRGETACPEASP